MEYRYRCTAKKCAHEYDTSHSIKAEPHKTCPKCKKETLERVIYGGCHVSVKSVTTVGQLAERNTKKMGRYGRDKAEKKRMEQLEKSTVSEPMKEAIRKSGGKLHTKEEKSKLPWYWEKKNRKETSEKINKMTPKQKRDYIFNPND
jgi:hypothetical protein